MADESLEIGIKAKLDEFKKDMATLGPEASKAGADMAAGIRKHLKAVEKSNKDLLSFQKKAAKNAADAMERAARDGAQAWERGMGRVGSATERTMGMMGGAFGDAADLIFDVLGPLNEASESLGGVAGAAAGAGVAVIAAGAAFAAVPAGAYALATALRSVMDEATAARDRLVALHETVDDTGIEEYTRSAQQLSIAIDRVKVAVGDSLGHELAVFTDVLADGVPLLASFAGGLYDIYWTATALGTLGGAPLVEWLEKDTYRSLTEANRASVALQTTLAKQQEAIAKAAAESNKIRDAMEIEALAAIREGERQQKQADERTKVAIAAEKRAQEIRDSVQTISAMHTLGPGDSAMGPTTTLPIPMGQSFNAGLADGEIQAVAQQFSILSDSIADTRSSLGELFDDLAKNDVADTLVGIRDAALEAGASIAGAIGDAFSELHDRALEQAKDLRASNARLKADSQAKIKQIADLREDLSQSTDEQQKKEIDGQIAALEGALNANSSIQAAQEEMAEAKERAARRAFAAQKAAAISEIAIQAAIALITALAQLGPIGGAIAAGGILTAAGTQAAIVAAQRPPEYPLGHVPEIVAMSSPDHRRQVAIRDDEAVLSGRGVGALGGPDAVRRANEGRVADGADTVVNLVVGRRVIAQTRGRDRVRVDPRAGRGRR